VTEPRSLPGAVLVPRILHCEVDGCPRVATDGTFCPKHYREYLQTEESMKPLHLRSDPTDPSRCRIEGCDDSPSARGLCGKHYSAAKNAKRLDEVALSAMTPHDRAVKGVNARLRSAPEPTADVDELAAYQEGLAEVRTILSAAVVVEDDLPLAEVARRVVAELHAERDVTIPLRLEIGELRPLVEDLEAGKKAALEHIRRQDAELADLRSRAPALIAEADVHLARIVELEQQLQEETGRRHVFEERLNSAEQLMDSAECAELRRQVEAARTAVVDAEEETARLRRELEDARGELATVRRDRDADLSRASLERRFAAWEMLQELEAWRNHGYGQTHPILERHVYLPDDLVFQLDTAMRTTLEGIVWQGCEEPAPVRPVVTAPVEVSDDVEF